ncbi:hypothetical protein AN403_1704 [Pseudomonas fluorescens]|uniref:Uncharacterized protein n=1 Tax=Pseudomonas fluorescens TaxID=294 RepID=A0A0P8WRM2_PSEFL|nr:hypothetical protein [Pseudomonas fluorescens]KPU56002.1 hypothetical protein AN403_1704 [Pseudomonas fluorescens]
MKRFIQGGHRGQGILLAESLEDYVSDTKPSSPMTLALMATN